MIRSLMQDPNQDETRHNVEVLIYLMTHPDVKLVHSGDMNKFLEKTYCFTPQFNQPIMRDGSNYDWPAATIVFTKRLKGSSSRNNNGLGGGGPARPRPAQTKVVRGE